MQPSGTASTSQGLTELIGAGQEAALVLFIKTRTFFAIKRTSV